MLQRLLLWLAPVSGLFLTVVSCVPIANGGTYEALAFLERGDPAYSRSQMSAVFTPYLVICWAGLITVLMLITVVLPMRHMRDRLSTSDKAFTVAAIIYMVLPMALLIWLAINEGNVFRSIAYLYTPWYVPMLIAGTTVYALALIAVLARPTPRSL